MQATLPPRVDLPQTGSLITVGLVPIAAHLKDAVLRRLDARLGRARAIWNSCASMSSCRAGACRV